MLNYQRVHGAFLLNPPPVVPPGPQPRCAGLACVVMPWLSVRSWPHDPEAPRLRGSGYHRQHLEAPGVLVSAVVLKKSSELSEQQGLISSGTCMNMYENVFFSMVNRGKPPLPFTTRLIPSIRHVISYPNMIMNIPVILGYRNLPLILIHNMAVGQTFVPWSSYQNSWKMEVHPDMYIGVQPSPLICESQNISDWTHLN